MTHEEYWKSIGFEDPVKDPTSKGKFRKCKAYCGAKVHKVDESKIEDPDEKEKLRSYCKMHVMHDDVKKEERVGQIVSDGHLFECIHASREAPHMYVT